VQSGEATDGGGERSREALSFGFSSRGRDGAQLSVTSGAEA
jgi:hypothetical protein